MTDVPSENPSEVGRLLDRAAAGDPEAWRALPDRDRVRLRRMVALRLDRRLQGRIDPSDVIQDAYIEAMDRLPEYLRESNLPFFLWLRLVIGQRLTLVHRHHLGAQVRDAGREVRLYHGALPEATSATLAAQLLGHLTRPSEAAVRAERNSASFLTNLGKAQFRKGLFDDAIASYQGGHRAGPEIHRRSQQPGRHPLRCEARLRRGHLLLRQGSRARPQLGKVPHQLGQCAQGQGPAGQGTRL
jgi:hypothetical protein